MTRLALVVLNTLAGIVLIWFLSREIVPRAFSSSNQDSSIWAWLALFVVGTLLAFSSAAYIGKTAAQPSKRWERFKTAWRQSQDT